jgi:SAM-dependent methyltransferase
MKNQAGIDDHTHNAASLAAGYAEIDRISVHKSIYQYLTAVSMKGEVLDVLDIGAGSGNDAFAIGQLGHKVTAVEPSGLLDIAIHDLSDPNVTYVRDALPSLVSQHDREFDVVLLSAVWQYIHPSERIASLRRIATLLRPRGKLIITFPSPPSRDFQFEIDERTLKQELDIVNEQ